MQKLIILDDVFDAATVQAIASFDYGDGLERWFALGNNPVHEKILAICGEHFDLSGIAGYEMIGWNGLFVPAGTPRDIVAKLHDASAKVLRRPDVIEQLAKLGAESVGNPQPEFAAFVQAETDRWGRIIRDKGIKPE